MALVTLLKHSLHVPALLSACFPLQPLLTCLGEGDSAPRLGAFAQERCQASWGRQALSSTGVQLTWDTRCCPEMHLIPVPQEGLGSNFVIVLTLLS